MHVISFGWMLVQLIAWRGTRASHYPNQCWYRSSTPYIAPMDHNELRSHYMAYTLPVTRSYQMSCRAWIQSLCFTFSVVYCRQSHLIQHIETETKWTSFSRRYFQMHFREWNCINSYLFLGFIPKGPINNIPALDQIMAWRRPGDKPLSEPMMVNLLSDAYMRHSASMS